MIPDRNLPAPVIYPVIRSVRKLPSGRVEYTFVDDKGNIRKCNCPDNLYAYTDVQDFLRKVCESGIPPRSPANGATRSERMKEQWQTLTG